MSPLVGVRINSNDDFKNLAKRDLKESSFPILLLNTKPVYATFDRFKAIDELITSLEDENHHLSIRDTLNMLENAKLRSLIEIKDREVQLGESTIATLNTSISALNNQLDQTRNLAEDCNKFRRSKSMLGILIGGGIGFGVGAILGILVAK